MNRLIKLFINGQQQASLALLPLLFCSPIAAASFLFNHFAVYIDKSITNKGRLTEVCGSLTNDQLKSQKNK